MLDKELKIENAKPLKINNIIKLKSIFKTKNILKKEYEEDKDFNETILVDEILEAEDE